MSDRTEFLHPDYEPGEFDQRRAAAAPGPGPRRRAGPPRRPARRDPARGPRGRAGDRRRRLGGAALARCRWPPRPRSPRSSAASGRPARTTGTGAHPAGRPRRARRRPSRLRDRPADRSDHRPAPRPRAGPTGAPAHRTVPCRSTSSAPIGDDKPTYRLFREFVRGPAARRRRDGRAGPRPPSALAMNAQPYSNTDGYLQPWRGTTRTATVTHGRDRGRPRRRRRPERLSTPRSSGWPCRSSSGPRRPPIQQGTLPVRFEVADGTDAVRVDLDRTGPSPGRRRDRLYEDVAPIWVDVAVARPGPPGGQAGGRQGPGDRLRGQRQLAAAARHAPGRRPGSRTASDRRPDRRASYAIDLGTLAAGDYTIRVFATRACRGRRQGRRREDGVLLREVSGGLSASERRR